MYNPFLGSRFSIRFPECQNVWPLCIKGLGKEVWACLARLLLLPVARFSSNIVLV